MERAFPHIEIDDVRISPAEAEVQVRMAREAMPSLASVTGRMVGPMCAYATTIEVAYRLRPLPMDAASGDWLRGRIVIPEPSLWEPATPFLYHGLVKLCDEAKTLWQLEFAYGLRAVSLGATGITLNGRPLAIRATQPRDFSNERLAALRSRGGNAILAPMGPNNSMAHEQGNRLGFFVLGIWDPKQREPELGSVRLQPSSLGILIRQRDCYLAATEAFVEKAAAAQRGIGVGVWMEEPGGAVPEWARFLVCQQIADFDDPVPVQVNAIRYKRKRDQDAGPPGHQSLSKKINEAEE